MSRQMVVSAATAAGIEEFLGRPPRATRPGARGVRAVDSAPPDATWRDRARGQGVDVCVRPEGFDPGAVVFDGDGTLLAAETIDVLGELAGAGPAIAAVTRRAMEGALDFETALRDRVRLLRGLGPGDLAAARERIALHRGVDVTLAELWRAGRRLAVLSGGFHFLLDPLAIEYHLDRVVANRLELSGGRLTGELTGDLVDADAKATALLAFCDLHGVAPARSVAVGDGANDLPMLRAAGLAVGFLPKPVVAAAVDGIIASGDMRALLDFLAED